MRSGGRPTTARSPRRTTGRCMEDRMRGDGRDQLVFRRRGVGEPELAAWRLAASDEIAGRNFEHAREISERSGAERGLQVLDDLRLHPTEEGR